MGGAIFWGVAIGAGSGGAARIGCVGGGMRFAGTTGWATSTGLGKISFKLGLGVASSGGVGA